MGDRGRVAGERVSMAASREAKALRARARPLDRGRRRGPLDGRHGREGPMTPGARSRAEGHPLSTAGATRGAEAARWGGSRAPPRLLTPLGEVAERATTDRCRRKAVTMDRGLADSTIGVSRVVTPTLVGRSFASAFKVAYEALYILEAQLPD